MKVKTVAVAADQSEKRTTGASIERKTSLRLHLHNQSQPLLTDVRLIELSAGFSCFLSSLFHALGNVLYFTLTPFTAKDILMYIYVNIFFFPPDCCQGDAVNLSLHQLMIDHRLVRAN